MHRIVLTGGPGAGKTTVAAHIAARRPERYVVVPEAATQIYHRLRTRWDLLDKPGRRSAQVQIYRLQIEQASAAARGHPGKDLLLDRGTVDGAAYWPDGAEDYWRALGTTLEAELARYDMVIWLQSTAEIGLYDGECSNPCRFEDTQEAIACGQRLAELWRGHPNYHAVAAFPTLAEKIAAVETILKAGDKVTR
jgi:predicted ATPase